MPLALALALAPGLLKSHVRVPLGRSGNKFPKVTGTLHLRSQGVDTSGGSPKVTRRDAEEQLGSIRVELYVIKCQTNRKFYTKFCKPNCCHINIVTLKFELHTTYGR